NNSDTRSVTPSTRRSAPPPAHLRPPRPPLEGPPPGYRRHPLRPSHRRPLARPALATYGPWQTVYERFNRWSQDGTWDKLLGALHARLDAGGKIDLSEADFVRYLKSCTPVFEVDP